MLSIVPRLVTIFFHFIKIESSSGLIILFSIIILAELLLSLLLLGRFEKSKQDLENLQLAYKTLNTMHDNMRAFKHDFNNIIQSIGGCIETEDLDSLKLYYKDLIKDCYNVNNLEYLNPEIINNPPLYNILASKYYKSESKNIPINFEIEIGLDNLNISNYELTRILGILLDNSIEASSECDDKLINVKFYDDSSHNRDLVIIENTYLNKDVDTIKIFEKSYSTKPNNTGLGLWEVNRILNKHKNLSLFTTKNDKFFIQQLEIYKN